MSVGFSAFVYFVAESRGSLPSYPDLEHTLVRNMDQLLTLHLSVSSSTDVQDRWPFIGQTWHPSAALVKQSLSWWLVYVPAKSGVYAPGCDIGHAGNTWKSFEQPEGTVLVSVATT